MKTLTIVCNVILVTFTLLVLATDGVSAEPPYIALTILILAVPSLTVIALVGRNARLGRLAAAGNVILLAFVCWAIIDQHPHPDETGFIPYVIAIVGTPLLNAVVLVLGGRGTATPVHGY